MIELLLGADRLLSAGDLDHAERIYTQVSAADPRNAIAIVGLARVALARGDRGRALAEVRRSLAIDPDDAAAIRLAADLATPELDGVAPEPGSRTDRSDEPAAGAPEAAEPPPASRPGPWRRLLARLLGR